MVFVIVNGILACFNCSCNFPVTVNAMGVNSNFLLYHGTTTFPKNIDKKAKEPYNKTKRK